jgi:hypothetical protein
MSILEIKNLIKEYYDFKEGVFIAEHLNLIEITTEYKISKRAIKHIVEKRKIDKYEVGKIQEMFEKFLNIKDDLTLVKIEKEVNTFLLIEKDDGSKSKEKLIVVYENNGSMEIKTIFYKPTNKVNKLLRKNKN